ncbi:acyltransferase [Rhodococcoides trifolii]|uniref:1-acyl-sn-glycerol-3-phosphate acyltransferase n=1 Tax=Rhodococcoides trifolii TaxID=908250 RepID=A0A917CM00_9NOCA|nr:HAD-IB family hydrolase [Rhodococcus trifolii]GGF92830.1 acyltransferase [Rhodococcus trifolii]
MITMPTLLEQIADAPRGPGTVAFFDFDGTVIDGFSAGAIFKERLRRLDVNVVELWDITSAVLEMRVRNSTVDNLMDKAVRALEGKTHEELLEQAYALFRSEIAAMIFPQIRAVVHAHHEAGHLVVMSTSATPYQAVPVCDDLGFDDLIATIPTVDASGVLTGELDGRSLWGPRKAQAILDWAESHDVDIDQCFGYSNGFEDVPMLETVGTPVALNPDKDLEREARERGWPTLHLTKPQRGADVVSTVRTVTALGSVMASAGLGAALGILGRNRRTGANVTNAMAPALALAIMGVKVEVEGEENLWSHRPAVFMFNHQSTLDAIVVSGIIARDVTAIAKKELSRDPRFALLGAVFDVAYVDRSDSKAAREAMQPAIDKLHSGVSVAIAPEGTRMPTTRLGKFKKGGFHLAMEAGVPIVPIVLHDTGSVMWKSSFTAHSGSVRVTVGEPIPTTDWDPTKLDEYVDDVRSFFDRTLGNV